MSNRLPIDEKQVQDILQFRQEKLEAIQTRLEYLARDVINTNDIIRAVSMRSKRISDMPKGTGAHTDLLNVLESYEKTLQRRDKEYAAAIRQLVLQEEQIERVWLCFSSLCAEEYVILYKKYVLNQLYSAVETESNLSHPIFEKTRKSGIQNIIRLYNSDHEDMYIAHIAELQRRERKQRLPANDKELYQLSLEDFMSDIEQQEEQK